jgi:hypothetical protein
VADEQDQHERAIAPLCFIDTETDGVHPGRRVWEVAAVRREPDGTERTYEAFVDIDLSTADPFGLGVGGFYARHPDGRFLAGGGDGDLGKAVSPFQAAYEIARITHGAHLVAAVPSFDAEVLAALLREHQLAPAWHYHLICVENLAVGALAARGTPIVAPWKSDELTEALGVEPGTPEEKHTAMGDVAWAMRMYDAVMNPPAAAP